MHANHHPRLLHRWSSSPYLLTRPTHAEARGNTSRPRVISKRSLSVTNHKRASHYLRPIEHGTSSVKITPRDDLCRETTLTNAREVTMRASGSSTAFGRTLWPQAPALAQFQPEPGLDARRDVQSPDMGKRFFEKPTEPAGTAPTEVSFGSFRLLPTRFL